MSNQPSRVAFFIRSATGNIEDLRRQQKVLVKEFVRRGFDLSGCAMEIYQDTHQSGLRHGPEFQRMFRDVADGKIDVVMVARMNRISRSLPELMKFTRFIADHRTRFFSAHENVDSSHWTSMKNAEGF